MNIKEESDKLLKFIETATDGELDRKLRESGFGSLKNETELQSLRAENKLFREMLAFNLGGANLYCDDGELQDASERPFIDWKRDSAQEIQDKISQRNLNYFRKNPHPMVKPA